MTDSAQEYEWRKWISEQAHLHVAAIESEQINQRLLMEEEMQHEN